MEFQVCDKAQNFLDRDPEASSGVRVSFRIAARRLLRTNSKNILITVFTFNYFWYMGEQAPDDNATELSIVGGFDAVPNGLRSARSRLR